MKKQLSTESQQKLADIAAILTPVFGLLTLLRTMPFAIAVGICFVFGIRSKKYKKVAIFGAALPIVIVIGTLVFLTIFGISKLK